MKLPFLFKNTTADTTTRSSSSWPWPSCNQPRTLSFRAAGGCAGDIFKTINSAYLDAASLEAPTPESWFTNSSESASFSTAASTEDDAGGGGGADLTETVIRGLRSSTEERLFFEPGETNSILEEAKVPFKESLVMSMESRDPYVDFRKSMEEMVEAHGLKEWENLEELLCWYLRVNGKHNHDYIVGAFVDLLVGLAISSTPPPPIISNNCASSSSSSSSSLTDSNNSQNEDSPLSFYTSSSSSSSTTTTTTTTTPSPCVSSSLEAIACQSSLDDDDDDDHDDDEKEINEIEEGSDDDDEYGLSCCLDV